MRDNFERQLMQLNTELITMGALCEDAIDCAVKCLRESDKKAKENAADLEKQIDRKERDIETMCLRIILHQQPVAADLRTVSSALKMISDMVTMIVESFVKRDIGLARAAIALDDKVDELFLKVKSGLIEAVRQGEDNGETLIDLLMIAKYFERIGDHAENIAEWVIYSVTGSRSATGEQLIFDE